MATTQTKTPAKTETAAPPAKNGNGKSQVPALAGPRLPYHPAIEERFGIDKASWKALCEAIFPVAQTTESVILALSYCKARKLDPFKRNVHIVPIWDKKQKKMVDTVWPGIGELRTTAFRTGLYAGRDKTEFGPDVTHKFKTFDYNGKPTGEIDVTFPEWAQVTVHRVVKGGIVRAFEGPQVYWMETFAEDRNGCPNTMWRKRTRGQLDKCAEAAALRAAFPEECGDQFTEADGPALYQNSTGQQQHEITMQKVIDAESQLENFSNGHGGEDESQQEAATEEVDPETGEVTEATGAEASATEAAEDATEAEETAEEPTEQAADEPDEEEERRQRAIEDYHSHMMTQGYDGADSEEAVEGAWQHCKTELAKMGVAKNSPEFDRFKRLYVDALGGVMGQGKRGR